ncbi:ANTAR domain-containing protein [Xylanimonas sp. McL0601]|uniref:ANTAR domain-containing protein n=1 Tax=Xylanimonas sp. McL0601 TaxID=3414739 RepID=UPI003CEB487B
MEPTEVARVLGAGVPLLVGRIHVDLATGECAWSPEVEIMHGPRRGRRPSLDALRSCLHPDDQARVASAVVDSARKGKPFAAAHRVVDTRGRTHTLVVVSGASRDAKGGAVEGAVVDVTPAQREALARERDGVVARAMVERATVERATGALMAVGGLDDDAATRLLNDAAARAGVTGPEAAHQVLAHLVPDDEPRAADAPRVDAVRDALDAVAPVARHDAALLARRRTRKD